MIRINVEVGDRPCVIQDPWPPTKFVKKFEPNTSDYFDAQWNQMERLGPQLASLESLGFLSYSVGTFARPPYDLPKTQPPAVTDQADSENNPAIYYAAPGVITAASMALVITGNLLLADLTAAMGPIQFNTPSAGAINTYAMPGADGLKYAITVIDTGGGGLSVAIVPDETHEVITIDLGGSGAETVTTVANLINNPASVTYGLVYAEISGNATAVAELVPKVVFANWNVDVYRWGQGPSMDITLAGLPCVITGIDTSGYPEIAITVDTPVLTPLSLATDDSIELKLQAAGKIATIMLRHA